MKKLATSLRLMVLTLLVSMTTTNMQAQGWPENYGGVMLQGFYWDSFDATKWTTLSNQATELGQYFDLVWIPQSGNCGGTSMGYDDLYWFPGHYDSSFGTETELRNLIATFKAAGIGTIADVVINHRKPLTGSFGFPSETYNNVTYTMTQADVVSGDGGTGSADTGEGWDGMPDLDHKGTNVQNICKAYTKMLLDDFGYAGFRYDMVKGYAGSYTALYNNYAKPQFSVGEYWDGNATTVKNWINAASKTSAAFDFPFRYTVRDAINNEDWKKLSNASLASDNNYKRYSVTFVENHDTEYRSASAQQDPIKADTLAANAYLLAMPGTPCVFLKHWQDCKQDIKAMIDVRKAAGIHNMSTTINFASSTDYYAVAADSKLLAVVGTKADSYSPNQNYVKVLSGYHYAYYLNKSMGTAWIDKASGSYNSTFDATLTAVTNDASAQLVYTTDGSDPTASSTKATSGQTVTIPMGETTLKVGLLIGSTVSGIVTRTYTVKEPETITVHVNTDNVGWTYVNFWSWGGDGSHAPTNASWPGDKITTTKTVGGKNWYYKEFKINSDIDCVNFVFSNGTSANANQNQTVNVENVSKNAFFEISSTKNDGKYLVNDVTDSYTTSVEAVTTQTENTDNRWYNINGQVLNGQPTQKGIYINNGKKVVIK